MIRPITPDDTTDLMAIAEAIGFQPNELEVLAEILTDYFKGNKNSDRFWLMDDDHGPVGVAYCEQERMTEGTWNLQFIAIQPDRQGQGRGTALLRYVEQTLVRRGARILLVETSASLDRARAFYRQCGYEEEARIRDFYGAGDDKIVCSKALGGRGGSNPLKAD
ncbi:GNAT family N-acetyltransferase [bacterium]|nr:GNAT family N-acetyltransferase [bacterium]